MRRLDRWRRLLPRLADLFAVFVVAFVAWRLLVAPRFLQAAGRPAPPATLQSLDGGVYQLTAPSHRTRFLDFGASWCEPCRLSLPLVERYAAAHPEVDVLAIDVGESLPVVAAYAREHALRRVLMDPRGTTAAAYGVVAFPTMVVLDGNGYVRAKWAGFNPAIGLAMGHAEGALNGR